MLDVRRLQMLCEVARRGSVSGAAEALSYTPSAISQQISALERQVGMPLLERRPRGVVLTEAGAVLVEHARNVLSDLEAAEAALASLAALRSGQLRLASFATAGATVVPRALDTFHARYPGIDVRVEQATSEAGVTRLLEGRVNIALTVDQEAQPGVEIVELFDDPFRVAVHRSHPLAARTELRLAELAGERWIDVSRDVPGGDVLAVACARQGLAYRVTYESDDYTAIHELVAAGLGVALLPDLARLPSGDDVVLRPLGPDTPHRRIQAAVRPKLLRTAATTAMLQILREVDVRRARTADAQPVTASSS